MISIRHKQFLILGAIFGLVAFTSATSLAMQNGNTRRVNAFSDGDRGPSKFENFQANYCSRLKNSTRYYSNKLKYELLESEELLVANALRFRNQGQQQPQQINQNRPNMPRLGNMLRFSNQGQQQPQQINQNRPNMPRPRNQGQQQREQRRSGRKRERDEREDGVGFKDNYEPAEKKRRTKDDEGK